MGNMGAREENPETDTQDDSLLSGCQPHLSTFTSPPSTPESKTASERNGDRGIEYSNVPHVDSMP